MLVRGRFRYFRPLLQHQNPLLWSFVESSRSRINGGFTRSIFVASRSQTKNRPKKLHQKLDRWAKDDTERLEREQELEYQRKLQELHRLTAGVGKMIKKRQDEHKQRLLLKQMPAATQLERDPQKMYDALASGEREAFDSSSSSLLTPVVDIPEPIQERLGLSVKFLVSKHSQNWPLVLQTLQDGGGFKDLVPKDVRKFIYNIPKPHIPSIIPQLEQLLAEANIEPSSKILNVFIECLNLKNEIPPQDLELIESYVNVIRSLSDNERLPRQTYEILVSVYGKVNNIDKINELLVEMKRNDLKPSPIIYSNILKTLVYKSRNHKDAVAVFDSMKFLSEDTKPGTAAYRDVIVSYINNDDIEKGLDLYQEMITSRTPMDQEILVALARGCVARESLRFKAWDFMFQVYDNKWTPTIQTLEYILYLSSKDGDVALSRALYKKLAATDAVTKRAFTFLLMAYSKSKTLKASDEPPVVTMHEKGRNLRANLLSQETPLSEDIDPRLRLPFLPVLDITSQKEVMAESSALWAHTLIFNPSFINTEAYNTYLNIAAEFGTFDEFVDRFNFSKLADDAPTNSTRLIVEEPEDDKELEQLLDNEEAETIDNQKKDIKELTTSPILNKLSQKSPHVVTRTTLTYIIALKAAGRFKKYKFAQDVWMERGRYRKSYDFKSLPIKSKNKLDFEFANEMVQSLTKMNLLDDALAIIQSTEYQFKWSWIQLTPVYQACVKVGKDKHCQTLRGIAGRAQIRFEGKIRKRDYKEFKMRRGY